MLRIGDPGLERSSWPSTDSTAQMNRRWKASGCDPPIERCPCQGRHSDHVADAVERRNYGGPAALFFVDRSALIHRRMTDEALPCAPGFRRNLCVPDHSASRRLRLNLRFCANHATTSERRQPIARPLNLRFFENLSSRHSPAITQRSRRASRAKSWVHKSSCSGG